MEHYSSDGSLQLSLRTGGPHFRYELKERETGRNLGRAESGITIDDFGRGEFRGRQTVVFSSDNRALCVVEDTSDASPCKRYILFWRKSSGRYAATYLHPELDPIDVPCEFEGDFPDVIALTEKTITFSKRKGGAVARTIESVPTFPHPQSAIY